MTQSDKEWLEEKFGRVHDALGSFKDQCYERVDGIEKRVSKVEEKTSSNSRFIWMVTGGLILLSVIFGAIELHLKI